MSSPRLPSALRELLESELRAQGAPDVPSVRAAASAEFERLLRADPAWPAVPTAVLERALAGALQVALEGSPEGEHGPGDYGVFEALKGLLAHSERHDALEVGTLLDGKYEIEALLAEGGFGRVYRARDRDLDGAVAIKVLHSRAQSGRRMEAFRAEARRLTRLQHPNIVEWKTLNVTEGGRGYLVMELLEGEVLEDTLQREGRLESRRAARILLQVLDALRHAHSLSDGSSLLHLDLKPSNVFLVRRGEVEHVKVLDFGLSRFAGQNERGEEPVPGRSGDLGATTRVDTRGSGGSGVACTPHYCPPERAAAILGFESAPLDGRADLYSLGVMAYRMLAGRLPFQDARDALEMLNKHRLASVPPLAARGVRVGRSLARFVERCLRKAPGERFADANEAYEVLRRIVEPSRPALWLAAAALVVGGATVYSVAGGGGAPPALRAVIEEGRGALDGTTLDLGPARPARTVELVDLEPGDPLEGLRLTVEPRRGGSGPAGFSLEVVGDRRVAVRATEGGSREMLAYLELPSRSGPRFSAPFRLRYLDPADLSLDQLDVAGRAGRVLAPAGMVLEVVVRGPRDALPERAWVLSSGRELTALRDPARTTELRSVYRVQLDEVPWESGVPEFVLEDAAGNVLRSAVELPVALEPLAIESCRIEGATLSGGRWHVLAGDEPLLDVQCSRRARVSWRLEDLNGDVLGGGESEDGALRHRLDLGEAPWARRSLAGRILVRAEEGEWVAHARGSDAGTATATLDLEVRRVGAEFNVSVSGARERTDPASGEVVRYVSTGSLEVVVSRNHDVPMTVSVVLRPEDPSRPAAREDLTFAGALDLMTRSRFESLGDGAYSLELESRRLGPDGRAFEHADSREELELVYDTVAPEVDLSAWPADVVLRSLEELRAFSLPLAVKEDSWTEGGPGVEIEWTLERRRTVGAMITLSGTTSIPPGASLPFAPGVVPEGDWKGADGAYAMRLHARDFAGNMAVDGQEYHWTVSTEAPRLSLIAPSGGELRARSGQDFAVELDAEDDNDVQSVACELKDLGGALSPVRFDLRREGTSSRWVGSFSLDHRWAGKEVELGLSAVDGAGTGTANPSRTRLRVGPIPRVVPDVVEVSRAGRGKARMRRVPGNAGVPYVFGGRGDALENAAFRSAGLPDFASRSIDSSLSVEVPAGAIADFYMDEHEVTVAAYLEFVAAADGYADRAHWDVPRDEARRRELERELAQLAQDLPVVGVSFDEARAYARWAGRELPTQLLWEYAVRGAEGRPCSFVGSASLAAPGTEVNVGTGALWAVAQGADRTRDTGLADLCSNAAEWTCTPASLLAPGVDAEVLLHPRATGPDGRVLVAGGSFERPAFHFGVVARVTRSTRSPSIGFRCVLAAARVEAAFLEGTGDLQVGPAR